MDRVVVFAAGEIKDYGFVKSLVNDSDIIVCADGGYLHAQKLSLKIDMVIGDFDSSKKPEFENSFVLPVRKDETDTFFVIKTYLKKGYKEFLLFGGLGGRVDHSYANLQLIYYVKKNGANLTIFNELNKVYCFEENKKEISFGGFENISFFALFEDVKKLSIENSKYPLKDYDLYLSDSLCISNGFIDGNIKITKESGTILVIESK